MASSSSKDNFETKVPPMESNDREIEIERVLDIVLSLETKQRMDELVRIGIQDPELKKRIEDRLADFPTGTAPSPEDDSIPDHNLARLKYAGRRGFMAGLVVFVVFFIKDYFEDRWGSQSNSLLFLSHLLAIATFTVSLYCTYLVETSSCLLLRTCEKACLVVAILFLLAFQLSELRYHVDIAVGRDDSMSGFRETLNDSFSLRWGVMIFMYILFVPRPNFGKADDSRHRVWPTIVLVCGIVLCPVLLNVVFCFWNGNLAAAQSLSIETVIWLFAASVPAIYGHSVVEGTIRGERILGAWGNLRKIGSGGFATVYKATHRAYAQDVAIKFLKPSLLNSWEALGLFRTEAQAMAKLSHPHLVRIYHYDPGFDDLAYIVMEFVNGMTIDEVVKRNGPMQPSRVVHILRQVMSALQEIHANKMLHRDISPQNVMLCRFTGVDDFVKVLDLGIVLPNLEHRKQFDGAMPWFQYGNPRYMSPEQERGDKDLDERCDIFCVGALAYRMLTARYLKLDRITCALQRDPEPQQILLDIGCPRDLADIVIKCSQLERSQRFGHAHEVIAALEGVACEGDWNSAAAASWWKTAK
jgi:eukaryotic-like serine/threonine-protein kinase